MTPWASLIRRMGILLFYPGRLLVVGGLGLFLWCIGCFHGVHQTTTSVCLFGMRGNKETKHPRSHLYLNCALYPGRETRFVRIQIAEQVPKSRLNWGVGTVPGTQQWLSRQLWLLLMPR